jgi:SAM-dependent methyltransferase
MKLMVNAATYWASAEEVQKKCWLQLASQKKHGIGDDVRRTYGTGSTYYHGEASMRLDGQIEFLKHHAEDFTHVLCTDAWDVLFLTGLDEIIAKYKAMGLPPYLSSGSRILMNVPPANMPEVDSAFDQTAMYRYPSLAMYIAEIPEVIEMFSRMKRDNSHDSTPAYMAAWMDGWFRHAIDTQCEIFQDWGDNCIVKDGRLYNEVTGTYPCLLHVGGSYTRPDIGRDEQTIEWARQLGIIGPDEQHRYLEKQKVGLNIGSGQLRYESVAECKWVNVDIASRPPDQVPDLLCDVGKERLPFDNESVDYCVLHHLWEHLDADPGHALAAECYRVLKPGGKLIVTVPDMRALAQRWMLGQIDDYIYFTNVYGAYQGLEGDRHKRGFHLKLLMKDLAECAPWSIIKAHDWKPIPGADIKRDWWILGAEAVR